MAKKSKIVVCDTNILIEFFRGDEATIITLDEIGFENLWITSVTVGEIMFGMKKTQKKRTQQLLDLFNVLHFDHLASRHFVALMHGFPSQQLSLGDGLIAAILQTNTYPFFTYNREDFLRLPGIELYGP